MSIVLRHQVEASERAADELEVEASHSDAMLCRDIEDHIENLVNLFAKLNQTVERWQSSLKCEPGRDGELEALYRRLERLCARSPALIQAARHMGFEVSGEQEFTDAWRELRGIVCFSVDEILTAAEQVRRGEVRSLREVMHELWDRPVDQGAA
jgi:hypothetical protein